MQYVSIQAPSFSNLPSPGLSVNGVQSHSHAPTHTSIYLGMLSSHVQKFMWQVKKFVLQFPFCKDHLMFFFTEDP